MTLKLIKSVEISHAPKSLLHRCNHRAAAYTLRTAAYNTCAAAYTHRAAAYTHGAAAYMRQCENKANSVQLSVSWD